MNFSIDLLTPRSTTLIGFRIPSCTQAGATNLKQFLDTRILPEGLEAELVFDPHRDKLKRILIHDKLNPKTKPLRIPFGRILIVDPERMIVSFITTHLRRELFSIIETNQTTLTTEETP